MFQPDDYLATLTALLQAQYKERLLYVGLQGSYLRGEATENSDIDVMVVVRDITVADLAAYRRAIESLTGCEKSCGFICGEEELRHWNALEISHLLHTTRDYLGVLKELVPSFTAEDIRSFVKMSLGNLYHELCHRYIHGARQENIDLLPMSCKGVFFILQNLHALECGVFIGTKRELCQALTGLDQQVMQLSLALAEGADFDLDAALTLLLTWCRDALVRTSHLPRDNK